MTALHRIIADNRAGGRRALPSICSAHRDVLRAAMLLPEIANMPLLIEATSNQVNQDGGYTGMTPVDFVAHVHGIAAETGFDRNRIILGGDHLGPQAWKDQAAGQAMAKARTMMTAYVQAGFSKIHLDCSEGCAGEPAHLDDDTVAARAAELADVCEAAAADPSRLSYIIGTEVPVPGGARADHDHIAPTTPAAARQTLKTHFVAFSEAAQRRIVGLVVQPGVEFGAQEIDHLPQTDQTGLRAVLDPYPGLTFEAHSTDYQHPDAYARLADMGFAIHKVGPALTFAYRQAIYALDHVRAAVMGTELNIQKVLETEMRAHPHHWQGHLSGDARQLQMLRHFSFSDRIRYYWPHPPVQSAVAKLRDALRDVTIPAPICMQYFAPEVITRAAQLPANLPHHDRLTLATIQMALVPYFTLAGQAND